VAVSLSFPPLPFPHCPRMEVDSSGVRDSHDVYVQSLLLYKIDQNGTILVNFSHSRWKYERHSYVRVWHWSLSVASRTDYTVDLSWKRKHTHTHTHTQPAGVHLRTDIL
jgi:hypothetical protein